MKGLLKIVVGGFLVFMLLAIAQEWRLFYSAWFGSEETAPEVAQGDRQAASEALHLALDLMGHLYRSGGDPRFAERLPASEAVVAEMMADIDYLADNGLLQEPQLAELKVIEVEALALDRLEINTREVWQMRILWSGGRGEAEPTREEIVRGRYMLLKSNRGWRVVGWAFHEAVLGEGEATP